MNEEVENLGRLWPKPMDQKKTDPLAFLSASDKEEIKRMESFWRSTEGEEPEADEGVPKKVLCHKCRVAFESTEHDRQIVCPECKTNSFLSMSS